MDEEVVYLLPELWGGGKLAMKKRKLENAIGMVRLGLVALATCTFAVPAAWGQQGAPVSLQQGTSTSAPAIPSYPDTPHGLEKMMKQMLKLEEKNDTAGLAPYLQSLVLPNADAWFQRVFGENLGEKLASIYAKSEAQLPTTFSGLLAELNQKKTTDAHATKFTDSCNGDATARSIHF